MTPVDMMHEMVERFNREIIGLPIPNKPTMLNFERGEFRLAHMREELTEIEQAISDENLEESVDGLVDLVYVALGALIEMGVAPTLVFEEVHRANMERKRGEKSTRSGSLGYDAVKPDGWKAPDLLPLLNLSHRAIRRATVRPKILVIGHGRHGKDSVCEILRDLYGLRFTSSSWFCAERVLMPYFASQDKFYESVQACYDDRHNGDNRSTWFDQIRAFNTPDATALARGILEENDIYCGMRSADELISCRAANLFDAIWWVDRSRHVQPEPVTSCTVMPGMAHMVIDNNGTLEALRGQVHRAYSGLIGHMIASDIAQENVQRNAK